MFKDSLSISKWVYKWLSAGLAPRNIFELMAFKTWETPLCRMQMQGGPLSLLKGKTDPSAWLHLIEELKRKRESCTDSSLFSSHASRQILRH